MSNLYEDKTYSLEEFLNLVKEEERAELYEGKPIMMSPASFEHEGVVAKLITEFGKNLQGNCLVFASNLQVILPLNNTNDVTVLPDISIVCDRDKLRNKRCYSAPNLVVEVLSPGTYRNDLLLKKHYYEQAGVQEYIIVNYHNAYIEKHILLDQTFQLIDIYTNDNKTFHSTTFPEVTFSIDSIFSFIHD